MITISMDKNATIMKELPNGFTESQTMIYRDLSVKLQNTNEITVVYPYGMRKRRIKFLEDMGFKLDETIYYNDEAPYSKIKQVWNR